ncbi:meiosis-specific component of sister chromatid cohesion complex [Verticillium nonalfalfae]|uniref:Meiosis-specific component of sister chromatid cohesion complex n=1 Tax=Verticillium nonalfalfae TaxID=1051616 RepID=A0A3M9XZH8_9PEZI|nr:meiosis-specific component of sister chromatid cohesion complex [Verticillium nonalfalfae]RNJ53056.1 meiosis-specific component of sister chromatid cohesion complex [Verticillium nonalfalfae]
MFYSNDILTNPRHGVSTIWLVATVGPRGGALKVTRKAIQEVNVRKACETILQPGAPLALRVQGNLLYGVSRVFAQQCVYVLGDAEKTRTDMQMFYQLLAQNDTDPKAGLVEREQILLPDDPSFVLDPVIPAFNLNGGGTAFNTSQSSSNKEFSQLSLVNSSSIHSGRAGSIMSFNLSQSDGGSLFLASPFRVDSSAKRNTLQERIAPLEQSNDLEGSSDIMFDIDDEGNIIGIADPFEEPRLPELLPNLIQQDQFINNDMAMAQEEIPAFGDDNPLQPPPNEDDVPMLEKEPGNAMSAQQQLYSPIPQPDPEQEEPVPGTKGPDARSPTPSDIEKSRRRSATQAFDNDLEDNTNERRVRPRLSEETQEPAQGQQDADMGFIVDNDDELPPEVGLGEQEHFEDRMSSLMMPWNRTPSIHRPSSVGVFGSKQWSTGSRQPTLSPKVSTRPFERRSGIGLENHGSELVGEWGYSQDPSIDEEVGAAFTVNPQQEVGPQWMRTTLDVDSECFLRYSLTQAERTGRARSCDGEESSRRWVEFEELARPEEHSKAIAAQAFYHILTLRTKGMLALQQEWENTRPFGIIRIGVEVPKRDEHAVEESVEGEDASMNSHSN